MRQKTLNNNIDFNLKIMKKKYIKISAIVIALLFGSHAMAQKSVEVAHKGDIEITLDGDVADWSDVTANTIDVIFQSEVPTLTDPIWKALWDDNGIWVMVETFDDLWFPSWISGDADYLSDKFELYFDTTDPRQDGGGASAGAGNWQKSYNYSEVAPGVLVTENDGVLHNDYYDGEGYGAMEYFIPYSSIADNTGATIDPYITTTIGFDVTVIDCDAPFGGRNRMNWNNDGMVDEAWNNMDNCGIITFANAETCESYETVSTEDAICAGEYYEFRGSRIYTEGNYESIDNTNCTIYQLDLAVKENYSIVMPAVIFTGQNYEGYSESGVYTLHYQSVETCDSIVELYLSVLDSVPAGFLPALDTIFIVDSVFVFDTLTIRDSVFIYDTLVIRDSVFMSDSIFVHDTISIYNSILITVIDSSKTISIMETMGELHVKLYPNPADVYVNINSDNSIKTIKIFDINGTAILVEDVNSQNAILNISEFAAGMYIIRISNNSGIVNKTLVIE